MNRLHFFIFFILVIFNGNAQINNSENLAREYYRLGDFEKAAQLFEDVYKKKKHKTVFDKYVDCLIKIQSYSKAEKVIKNFYKKQKNPIVLIELGKIYELQGNTNLAKETFNSVLKEGKKTKNTLASIGAKFYKERKYHFALTAYLEAKKENAHTSYYIQVANIYSYLGDIDAMYTELIELIFHYPNYFQTCKNMIRRTISEDPENENNKKIKKQLIKTVQKNNSYEISKLLVWLFLQEKEFKSALDYEISIAKRLGGDKLDIIELSEIAYENNDYMTARRGLQYVLSDENSLYYEYCSLKLLDIKFELFLENKVQKNGELKTLKKEYNELLKFFGIKTETTNTLINYCHLLANELNDEDLAIETLYSAIENQNLDEYSIAQCKMKLAEILISVGNVWESILLYSQVEKKFKEDIIGQKAKYKKTKIHYYNGDFEWAQTQLNVLKHSTSKLIANDAMKLSLLISDNLNLDTTNTVLATYANAELLFEQKKYDKCLSDLDYIEINFPNHRLIDEVLFKKFHVFINTQEVEKALEALEQICINHYYDILYDDALFMQAEIYEEIVGDTSKAKEKYEEILLKTPNSIFINKAREKYRSLRENNILKL